MSDKNQFKVNLRNQQFANYTTFCQILSNTECNVCRICQKLNLSSIMFKQIISIKTLLLLLSAIVKKIRFVFCYTPFFTIPLYTYVSQITIKSQFHHLRLA